MFSSSRLSVALRFFLEVVLQTLTQFMVFHLQRFIIAHRKRWRPSIMPHSSMCNFLKLAKIRDKQLLNFKLQALMILIIVVYLQIGCSHGNLNQILMMFQFHQLGLRFFCSQKSKFGLNLQGACDVKGRCACTSIGHPVSASYYLDFVTSKLYLNLKHPSFLAPVLVLCVDNACVSNDFMLEPFKIISRQ